MKLFFSDDCVAVGHDFNTTRKVRWIADLLIAAAITWGGRFLAGHGT
jgi:hypothetical protein